MRKILRNRFKCKKCGSIIESKYCHDFVTCKCGAISCDGGHEYIRLCLDRAITTDDYDDLCEYGEECAYSEEARKIFEDVNGGSNEFEWCEDLFID